MLFTKLLKVFSLGLLALQGGQATMECRKEDRQGIDFTCGNFADALQPCKKLNFELSAGRTDSQTTTWLLGTLHDKEDVLAACIEEITASAPNHIIYFEGTEKGEITDCNNLSLKNKTGRKCIGFDNMQAHKQVLDLPSYKTVHPDSMRDVFIGKFKAVYKTEKRTDKDFHAYLKNKKNEYEMLLKIDEKKFAAFYGKSAIAAIDLLLTEHGKNKQSFAAIFSKIKGDGKNKPFETEKEKVQHKKLQRERNKSLLATLAKHPEDMVAVVCIGRHHVVKNDPYDSYDAEYIRSEMEKGPHQNRYAILALKNM